MRGDRRRDAVAFIRIDLPQWVDNVVDSFPSSFDREERRMRLVVTLSRRNLEAGGAPFAAAVFDGPRLIAAGVNRVRESGLSIAHAEIVALARAQRTLAHDPVSVVDRYTLVTSTEPCCQCLGAMFFSGMNRLVCGATRRDAQRVRFNEGPRSVRWIQELRANGISVARQVCRLEAKAVLDAFAAGGGRPEALRHPTIPNERQVAPA